MYNKFQEKHSRLSLEGNKEPQTVFDGDQILEPEIENFLACMCIQECERSSQFENIAWI
jgi:hypothetical protein